MLWHLGKLDSLKYCCCIIGISVAMGFLWSKITMDTSKLSKHESCKSSNQFKSWILSDISDIRTYIPTTHLQEALGRAICIGKEGRTACLSERESGLYRNKKSSGIPPFLNSSDQPGWHGNELERSPGILLNKTLISKNLIPKRRWNQGAVERFQKKKRQKVVPTFKRNRYPQF